MVQNNKNIQIHEEKSSIYEEKKFPEISAIL